MTQAKSSAIKLIGSAGVAGVAGPADDPTLSTTAGPANTNRDNIGAAEVDAQRAYNDDFLVKKLDMIYEQMRTSLISSLKSS